MVRRFRGAVAFALALTLDGTTKNAQYMITTTLCIVLPRHLFTVAAQNLESSA